MKTMMAVLMLMVSTSVLAVPPQTGQVEQVCENSNNHASFCRESNGTNVSVPEPSTLALMGLGLAAIALVRARKRKI